MKNKTTTLLLCFGYIIAMTACGNQDPSIEQAENTAQVEQSADHPHGSSTHTHAKKVPGPNGGRLVTSVDPAFEFYVTEDRKAQLTFVDSAGNTVAPPSYEITLTGGDRTHPTKLLFMRKGNLLISNGSLPDGVGYPIVLQIKTAQSAKTIYERITYNEYICSGCNLIEYACTCGH